MAVYPSPLAQEHEAKAFFKQVSIFHYVDAGEM